MRWAVALFLLVLIVTGDAEDAKKKKKKTRRKTRSLPSVSDHHYSELFRDGSYKFAYIGDRRYHTELRTRDGLVEGETLHIRPDGVPIKVHYFADKNGYRPKTEVLYTEKEVVIPEPDVAVFHPDGGQGRGHFGPGDSAVASPSVTAIVGPGAVAITTPQVSATAGHGAGSPNYPNPVTPDELARILKIISDSRDKGTGNRHGKYLHPVPVPVPVHHKEPAVYVVPPVDIWARKDTGGAKYSYSYAYALPGQNTYKDTTGYVSVKVNSN